MVRVTNGKLEIVESLIPTTHLFVPLSSDEHVENLKNLKLITFTLPILSWYKYCCSYNDNGLFTNEMDRCYQLMEETAISLVYKICTITRHTWKYGSNTAYYAQQFMFLFHSLFVDLPLTGNQIIEERTKKFLLETFDDLYFQQQIQLLVHDVFLGLDNIYLKHYIADFLEVKYGYKIPVNFFVIAICSLGLQLYRNKIEEMKIITSTSDVINNTTKKSPFHWLFARI